MLSPPQQNNIIYLEKTQYFMNNLKYFLVFLKNVIDKATTMCYHKSNGGGVNMKKIHQPYCKFKGWLRENQITYSMLSELLGINIATVSAKINGASDFTLSEINTIKNIYNLDNDIFFTDDVA